MTLLVFVFVSLIGGGLYWADKTEETCWKNQATQAFEEYGSLKTRPAILRATASTGREVEDAKSNPVELFEIEHNGCSLGSNGQTLVRFYFDNVNKLTTIQVFRNYMVSDPSYKMELIEERKF
jgi:hypothetical protein